jgi:hypothetical protein
MRPPATTQAWPIGGPSPDPEPGTSRPFVKGRGAIAYGDDLRSPLTALRRAVPPALPAAGPHPPRRCRARRAAPSFIDKEIR